MPILLIHIRANNYENISKINQLSSQLDENIITFKDNIKYFNESGEISYLKDSVELYVNTIKIINKSISINIWKTNTSGFRI